MVHPPPPGFILSLSADGGVTRLHAAYGARLRACESQAELLAACRVTDVELVILPWRDPAGESVATTVAAIRASRRRPPVRIYVERSAECLHALVPLVRAGAGGVIVRDIDDDAIGLRRLLDTSSLARATEAAARAVEHVISERHQPLFVLCLEHVLEPLSAIEAASRLGVSRRTLSAWARSAGARGMRSLASKCRVLVAVELIRTSPKSLEQVAHDLQFASSAHLHNTNRRYAGCAPRESVALDAAEWCRRLFATRVAPALVSVRSAGKVGCLPRNGPLALTTQDSPRFTGSAPGGSAQ
jgi:AraC-like DNA-binding protein